jgi:hypothetical protein
MKDLYAILGTDTNSDFNELREAYEKLSDKFNPELNANDHFFANRFREIHEAYEVLSDPTRRRQYDATFTKPKFSSASERRRIRKYYSTTKGVNSALTVILITLTLMFGYYVFKAISGSKTVKATKALAVNEAPAPKVKWHKKRRHIFRAKVLHPIPVKKASPVIAAKKDTVKAHKVQVIPMPVRPAAIPQPKLAEVGPKPVKQPLPKIAEVFKPAPVATPSKSNNNQGYLYTTYIKGNETGVIKMRETASYNAETVKTIPSDSKVAVLERGSVYYKVMFENMVGYVPRWTVQEK